MSKRKLTPTEVNAAKDVAEAIRRVKISEDKINDGITKANSLGRGFHAKRRTNALNVLIAIEGFLYESETVGHLPQDKNFFNAKTGRYYTTGRRTYGENSHKKKDESGEIIVSKDKLKYKNADDEKNAKVIELNGRDVAIAVMEFLKKEKQRPETESEAAKALELKKVGVNTAALGRQVILTVEDINQEDVTRALKEIALNIERLKQQGEGEKRAAELRTRKAGIFEEERSKYCALHGLGGEDDSVNGDDDVRSVNSQPVGEGDEDDDGSQLGSDNGRVPASLESLRKRSGSFVSELSDLAEDESMRLSIIHSVSDNLTWQIHELGGRHEHVLREQWLQEAKINSQEERIRLLGEKLESHLINPNAHPDLLSRGGTFVGGGTGVVVDYSGDLEEIKVRMDRMLEIQARVEEDLLAAKNAAEARELQAKKEADARASTLSEEQKKGFDDLRTWPIRISKVALNALGHYKNDLDEAGKAHTVKIPEISGRIRESDKTIELYESGLSVAIYDFGKRGLTYLGHDVDAAGNTAADRESMMTIARVIDPKGDGDSEDVYCVISSSPERGMSTTYISKNTFDDIALKSLKEYENAALATAKLDYLREALSALEKKYPNLNIEGDQDDLYCSDEGSVNSDATLSNKAIGSLSSNIRRHSIGSVVSLEDVDFIFDDPDDASSEKSYDDVEGGNSSGDEEKIFYKINKLKKVIKDAERSLDPESKEVDSDTVQREAVLKILSDYQSEVRKVFQAVKTFKGGDTAKQFDDARNNIKNDSSSSLDLYQIYEKKFQALGLKEHQIDEILSSDNLVDILNGLQKETIDLMTDGATELFENFGNILQRSREVVEDLYPTRSRALERAAEYSLEAEFKKETSALDVLKTVIAESSDTNKLLKNLTVAEKDNARRIASTEFSRNAAREIEMANKDKLDFNEFEKEAATAQLVQHWKSNRFFTGSNALASKETDVKEFFEKAKMSDSPYPGPQVTRPNRRSDMATVVFNGINRKDSNSEAGYEGDDIMYLHVRGTLAPKALYVKVQVATADNQEVKFYKDGKETTKIFQCGDLIIDESTVYTKDSLGNHNAQGVSSLGKADQSLCKNFKVKAMSVIDGERKTAILFEGVPITPQNGLAKAAQVQEVPVILLHQCTALVSLVTKKTVNKKGKEISDSGIYLRDASDPNKPADLIGPLMNDAKLVDELKKHGVTENIPTCESLKGKMNLPNPVAKSPSLGTSTLLNPAILLPTLPPLSRGGGR